MIVELLSEELRLKLPLGVEDWCRCEVSLGAHVLKPNVALKRTGPTQPATTGVRRECDAIIVTAYAAPCRLSLTGDGA